MISISIKV